MDVNNAHSLISIFSIIVIGFFSVLGLCFKSFKYGKSMSSDINKYLQPINDRLSKVVLRGEFDCLRNEIIEVKLELAIQNEKINNLEKNQASRLISLEQHQDLMLKEIKNLLQEKK